MSSFLSLRASSGRAGPIRRTAQLVVAAAKDFGRDDVLTHSAALALYTAVALAPLVVLLLLLGDAVGGDARKTFLEQISGLVGPLGGKALESIAQSAGGEFESRTKPTIVAVGAALLGAAAVFAKLQQALNHVWNVKPEPGWNLWAWLKKRLLTFGMLAVVGLLLLVSLAVSAGLSMVFTEGAWVWTIVELAASVAVATLLFAAMFRLLPDAQVAWRETWIGAAVTAVLFAAGKYGIGTYLGMSDLGRSYGAMGSLLALLVWVYWSSAIVLYGAEITQAYAKRRHAIRPRAVARKKANPHAG